MPGPRVQISTSSCISLFLSSCRMLRLSCGTQQKSTLCLRPMTTPSRHGLKRMTTGALLPSTRTYGAISPIDINIKRPFWSQVLSRVARAAHQHCLGRFVRARRQKVQDGSFYPCRPQHPSHTLVPYFSPRMATCSDDCSVVVWQAKAPVS